MPVKVHHLNCATLCPISGQMVCHCFLLETSKGLVLVDTGLGTKDIEQSSKRLDLSFRLFVRPALDIEETALYQIRKLGFKQEEVGHIILTHLHVDHAGGISDFPNAQIHTLRHEYNLIYNAKRLPPGYSNAQFKHEIHWNIHDVYGEKWMGFNKVQAFNGSDDILLIPLRGHTAGHCGIAVNAGTEGWWLHCGDAYFHRYTIKKGIRHTPWTIRTFQAIVEDDREKRLRNQLRLHQLYKNNKDSIKLVCSHDAFEYACCCNNQNPNYLL